MRSVSFFLFLLARSSYYLLPFGMESEVCLNLANLIAKSGRNSFLKRKTMTEWGMLFIHSFIICLGISSLSTSCVRSILWKDLKKKKAYQFGDLMTRELIMCFSLCTTTKTSFLFRGCSKNLACLGCHPAAVCGLDLNAMSRVSMTRRIKNDPILPRLGKTLQESALNFESSGDDPSNRLVIRLYCPTDFFFIHMPIFDCVNHVLSVT